jgi:hypothetical protein
MCELTLTETATMVNLAKYAMESFEATAEDVDKEGAKAHHSDDEVTSSHSSAHLGFNPLKSVRSEPVLKNKNVMDSTGMNGNEQRLETPSKSDSSFGSELGIHFVAAAADSNGSAKNLSVC